MPFYGNYIFSECSFTARPNYINQAKQQKALFQPPIGPKVPYKSRASSPLHPEKRPKIRTRSIHVHTICGLGKERDLKVIVQINYLYNYIVRQEQDET